MRVGIGSDHNVFRSNIIRPLCDGFEIRDVKYREFQKLNHTSLLIFRVSTMVLKSNGFQNRDSRPLRLVPAHPAALADS